MEAVFRRFASFFLLLPIAALAVELISGPTLTQQPGQATLSWSTDTPCGSRLSYGTRVDRLEQKISGPVTTTHTAVLTGLPSAGTIYYELGSARTKLAAGSFVIGQATSVAPAASTAAAEEKAPKSLLERVVDALRPQGEKPGLSPKAAPSSQAPRAPPTHATWGRMETLQDHFDRHGADFHSKSPDEYAAQAWHFLQRARAGGLLMKWDDADGTLRVYDPATRAFAAYTSHGKTKTYFRPNSPTYWQRQPGRSIQPAQIPFP
jgi:hypothetical protein